MVEMKVNASELKGDESKLIEKPIFAIYLVG
jgi:hypothetical protein